MKKTVFLFGEAERGDFCLPCWLQTMPQLEEKYGNPPPDTQGILYAVQALMYDREIIYFRVQEEGFSLTDYRQGIDLIAARQSIPALAAICMPGVGDASIIEASAHLCLMQGSILIVSEKDLYDYLMA